MNYTLVFNLAFGLLKAMGVSLDDSTRASLSALLPQIPAKAIEVVEAVNAALKNSDVRFGRIEKSQDESLARLDEILSKLGNGDSVPRVPPMALALSGEPNAEIMAGLAALENCKHPGTVRGDNCKRCLVEVR